MLLRQKGEITRAWLDTAMPVFVSKIHFLRAFFLSVWTLGSLVVASWVCGGAAYAQKTPPASLRFGITFWVASQDDSPVVSKAWLESQRRIANRIFRPTGVQFETASIRRLADKHRQMHSRRDRHQLGKYVEPGTIHCFVVDFLRDVDEPERRRMGVHWHAKGLAKPAHFVILAKYAGDSVLAHELGHFMGNRRHSSTPGNIMSYHRGDMPPFFDASQKKRIKAAARDYQRQGELSPWPPVTSQEQK